MKIGYRESLKIANQGGNILSALRYPAHRHTLFPKPPQLSLEELKKKRLTRLETFKLYTEKVLPKMEETIEIGLLRDVYNKISNEFLKNELLLAYKRRRINIAEIKKPYEPFRVVSDVTGKPPGEPVDVYADDILAMNEHLIGYFLNYSSSEMDKVFPGGPLGDYNETQFKITDKLSLMCTEEAFKLTNEMRKINYPRLTENDYTKIFADAENTRDYKSILNDEELYPRITHDFAITFLERLEPHRKDELINKLFIDCYVFDIFVNILVRELPNNTFRPYLLNTQKRAKVIDQILEQIKAGLKIEFANPTDPKEILKNLKLLKIILPDKKTKEGKQFVYNLNLVNFV
jgi:hypothetical protein